MSKYFKYLDEIQDRAAQGLSPKPISDGKLLCEIIKQIKESNNPERDLSIKFLTYNVSPGTTDAATFKAQFLKNYAYNFF